MVSWKLNLKNKLVGILPKECHSARGGAAYPDSAQYKGF